METKKYVFEDQIFSVYYYDEKANSNDIYKFCDNKYHVRFKHPDKRLVLISAEDGKTFKIPCYSYLLKFNDGSFYTMSKEEFEKRCVAFSHTDNMELKKTEDFESMIKNVIRETLSESLSYNEKNTSQFPPYTDQFEEEVKHDFELPINCTCEDTISKLNEQIQTLSLTNTQLQNDNMELLKTIEHLKIQNKRCEEKKKEYKEMYVSLVEHIKRKFGIHVWVGEEK